jgi:hypothetical protein
MQSRESMSGGPGVGSSNLPAPTIFPHIDFGATPAAISTAYQHDQAEPNPRGCKAFSQLSPEYTDARSRLSSRDICERTRRAVGLTLLAVSAFGSAPHKAPPATSPRSLP